MKLKINSIMKKMYTNKPILDTESLLESTPSTTDSEKRIKVLEEKVRMLSEQIHKIASTLSLNSRQIRKQNTDINNVTTAVRSKFS
jgi:septal ring factor EnvC (AmiA/AmiB activator)